MPYFDTHAHYDDPRFDEDRESLLASLPANDITRVVNVGADLPSSYRSAALAAQYPFVYAAVGVHPHEAKSWTEETETAIRQLLQQEKVVALGEIGLDFYYDLSERDTQAAVFRRQMAIASELDVPVIIHSREATELTLEILREFPNVHGVVHCFSGSAETAMELVKMGWYVGFTGVVTFKNARKPLEAAAAVPLDRLVLETDCPYMTPVPFRGKRCDSTMLPLTAEKIAETRGISVDTLVQAAWENGCRLYRMPC